MERPPEKSLSRAGFNPDNLWYIPDRRLGTKAAADKAIAVVDCITAGGSEADEPDEQALFTALHTCAYRARRRGRGKPVPGRERIRWAHRWARIREHLVEKNLGLAYLMIRKLGSTRLDQDDLLSDAMLGLTHAVDRFDPEKGYRFSTYACNVIARGLMRFGKREGSYRRLFPVQFDASFERAEGSPDEQAGLYLERLRYALDRNLGGLTDLESQIVAERFPSGQGGQRTFREIGRAVGLSKERVRQIQKIALRKLRDVLNEDPLLQ